MTDFLEVSTDSINWTPQASNPPFPVTIPPAPPPYARSFSFSNQIIPPQYLYFRLGSQFTQGGTCQVYTYVSSPQPLCRPNITPTVTPSTTPFACCNNLSGGVLPQCTASPQTGQITVSFYDEIVNQCAAPAPVQITNYLEVSTNLVTWNPQAQLSPVAVVVPPGPPPYAVFGAFPAQAIPAQYLYYRVVAVVTQLANCQTFTFYSNVQTLCRPNLTPSPTPTGTPFVLCDVFPSGSSTTCAPPGTFSYSFGYYTYCPYPLTGQGTIYLEIAPNSGGPWTIQAQQTFTHTFPPGPPGTSQITGTFTEPNIPPQYTHYRVRLVGSASNGQPLANMTGAAPICGGTPTVTPTPCPPILFNDVLPDHPFYPFVRCLACRGIVSGYICGGPGEPCGPHSNTYFRPYADVNRGQLSKIIAGAAGLNAPIPSAQQTFTDVPATNPFWVFVERLSDAGAISGYGCGGPGEPCDPQNRPYFRWGNNATRGQISKITAVTAGWNGPIPSTQQTFTDVPPTNPFWLWIEELAGRQIISGYGCGGPGEPCDPQNRPYFRWGANATRGQMSKIAANSFFPNCQTPQR
jgi:hypothetical protein